MNKKLIRLTESDLHRIVKESVNRVLVEEGLGDRFRGAMNGFRSGANQQAANDEDASTLQQWAQMAQRVANPQQAMQFVRNFANAVLKLKNSQYDWYGNNRNYDDAVA